MVVWVVSFFAAICAWLWTPAAHACKCAQPASASAEAASAAAVFEAQVAKITAADPQTLLVELKVSRAWKGVNAEQVTVRTPAESPACGYPFQLGQSYLVYAQSGSEALSVHHCSRTRAIEDAKQDIIELGLGSVPVTPHVEAEVQAQDGTQATNKPAEANAVTAQQERPAAGGCASCSAGHTRAGRGLGAGLALWGVLGVWLWRRRAASP